MALALVTQFPYTMTVDDFLVWDSPGEYLWELIDGVLRGHVATRADSRRDPERDGKSHPELGLFESRSSVHRDHNARNHSAHSSRPDRLDS